MGERATTRSSRAASTASTTPAHMTGALHRKARPAKLARSICSSNRGRSRQRRRGGHSSSSRRCSCGSRSSRRSSSKNVAKCMLGEASANLRACTALPAMVAVKKRLRKCERHDERGQELLTLVFIFKQLTVGAQINSLFSFLFSLSYNERSRAH